MNKELKKFKKYLILCEKSTATVEKYTFAVKEFLNWSAGKKITKEVLILYRSFLLEKYKPQTVNGKLSAINTYLGFINKNHLKVNFVKIQRSAFLEDSRQLTDTEYKRLLSAAKENKKEKLYLLLMTLCGTGIRISELKFITVEAVKRGQTGINMKGKYRTILLNKELCKKLKDYSRKQGINEGCIFITKSGKPMDRSNIFHAMKKLCKKANVDDRKVFPHNLRHLFARKFYQIEKNLSHLADILGHSRIETTRIYVATTATTHHKVLNSMKLVIENFISS